MSEHYRPEDSTRSARFIGVPTFARLPLVRATEDVDVAIVGVPFDTGASLRVGGRFAPNAIRAASTIIRGYNPAQRIHPFEVLSCVDYGDIAIVPGYIERSYREIEDGVAPLVHAGVIPILLGGDHSCTLAHLRAARSLAPVAVIDFDSHTDAWDSFYGERYNHGTWVRRAIEEGLIDTEHSVEVGLRGSIYSADDWALLEREFGLASLTTERMLELGAVETARTIRGIVGDRPTFISLDIDVVDPGFAPGTGTPEVGGPSSSFVLDVLRSLAGTDIRGADVVEVIPSYDPAGTTALLAAHLVFEILSLIARNRRAES